MMKKIKSQFFPFCACILLCILLSLKPHGGSATKMILRLLHRPGASISRCVRRAPACGRASVSFRKASFASGRGVENWIPGFDAPPRSNIPPPPQLPEQAISTSTYPEEHETVYDYDDEEHMRSVEGPGEIDIGNDTLKRPLSAKGGASDYVSSKESSTTKHGESSIRAYYLARKIDTLQIFQSQYGQVGAGLPPVIHSNSVMLALPSNGPGMTSNNTNTELRGHNWIVDAREKRRLENRQNVDRTDNGDVKDDADSPASASMISTEEGVDDESEVGYAVFLEFGACVFFGLSENAESGCLRAIEPFLSDRIVGMPRQENMMYEHVPALESWHKFDRSRDMISLQKIDMNTIRIVAGVIGQTVALDHYEREADSLLELFESLNQTIARSNGEAMGLQKNNIFKMVAQNNLIITAAITKLGLLDQARPGEAVWNVDNYYKVWTSLRDEFELDSRFKNLNTKLDFIAENLKFFAGALEHKEGSRLEIYIIILIAAELALGLYGHPELWRDVTFSSLFGG